MDKENRPASAGKHKKKKKSGVGSTIALVLVLLIGLGVMAYPTVSDWWNSFHASRAIASYSSTVENTNTEELEAMLAAARAYNQTLPTKSNPFVLSDEEWEVYNSLLNLSGTGIMGYVQIPSIGVNIPIYHSTDEAVLQIAVGHVEWSSLPVGGENTHAVLSGHRGLPSARLLTDLDKVKEGDRFTITVLNQTAAYEVDQIRVVEPDNVSELGIIRGEDYVTLVTCTPYGVNTHRLLVRGHRVQILNEAGEPVEIVPEAVMIPHYLTVPAVGIPLLFLLLVALLVHFRRRRR